MGGGESQRLRITSQSTTSAFTEPKGFIQTMSPRAWSTAGVCPDTVGLSWLTQPSSAALPATPVPLPVAPPQIAVAEALLEVGAHLVAAVQVEDGKSCIDQDEQCSWCTSCCYVQWLGGRSTWLSGTDGNHS